MKAIILAAGRGSRMKELTEEQPKCLLRLHGKSLLDHQLDSLHKAGITEIAIVTGYMRELLSSRGLVEFYNDRWMETNMVSSLACAEEWLNNDSCIVSYSDIFYEGSAVNSLINCQSNLAVTYDPNWLKLWQKRFGDPLLDAETFRMNNDGNLAEIGNVPNSVDEIEGQYMGLLRFTTVGWSELKQILNQLSKTERDNIHMTGVLQKVINAGRVPVAAIPYYGRWGELDNARDLSIYS